MLKWKDRRQDMSPKPPRRRRGVEPEGCVRQKSSNKYFAINKKQYYVNTKTLPFQANLFKCSILIP